MKHSIAPPLQDLSSFTPVHSFSFSHVTIPRDNARATTRFGLDTAWRQREQAATQAWRESYGETVHVPHSPPPPTTTYRSPSWRKMVGTHPPRRSRSRYHESDDPSPHPRLATSPAAASTAKDPAISLLAEGRSRLGRISVCQGALYQSERTSSSLASLAVTVRRESCFFQQRMIFRRIGSVRKSALASSLTIGHLLKLISNPPVFFHHHLGFCRALRTVQLLAPRMFH